MNRIACFVVACLSVCLAAESIDAGCGGGGSGAGLFGRGGGLFSRLRARRQQSAAASYGGGYSSSYQAQSYSYSAVPAPQAVYIPPATSFRYVLPQAGSGCNCPTNPVPAPDSAPMATPKQTSVVSSPIRYQTVMATRSPQGHTHTCPNGHTWDHSATPGHNCPICGSAQFVQDRSPRMVTVMRTVKVETPEVAYASVPQTAPAIAAPAQTYLSPVIYKARGGCANGSCSRSF